MLSETLKTHLHVLKCWKDLLAIEEFPEGTPKKATMQTVLEADPTAYRDDWRMIQIEEGDWKVQAHLCSGDTNYWLAWIVDGPDGIWYESEPEHEVYDGCNEVLIDDGNGIIGMCFQVELV